MVLSKDTEVRILHLIENHLRRIIAFNRLLVLKSNLSADISSILDVGSKYGSPEVKWLRNCFKENIFIVILDLHKPFLLRGKRNSHYNDYVLADASNLPFRTGSFDAVFCFEVLEHLKKKKGLVALVDLERVAKNLIVISTPVRFMPTGANSSCSLMAHRSAWEPEEFRNRGYVARGVIGPFFFQKEYNPGIIGRYLVFPATWLTYLLMTLYYYYPRLAYQMICAKEKRRQ